MSHKITVLVVDDNKDIRDLLQLTLEQAGYAVLRAKNAENAIRKALEERPQLILLDIMMPDMDGITLCKELRRRLGKVPVIVFLTARAEEYSEVAGFEAGANDYISKPIRKHALVRRIEVLLHRSDKDTNPQEIEVGDIFIDPRQYLVRCQGKELSLRRREFELLYFLAQHPGHFFSRDQLMKRIWGEDIYITIRTVDVHIRRIREKIGEGHILTLKGVGYAFQIL